MKGLLLLARRKLTLRDKKVLSKFIEDHQITDEKVIDKLTKVTMKECTVFRYNRFDDDDEDVQFVKYMNSKLETSLK